MRVTLQRLAHHALVLTATLDGDHVYHSSPISGGRPERFGTSHHQSGYVHRDIGPMQIAKDQGVPLRDQKGIRHLGGYGMATRRDVLDNLDWSYPPKADTPRRRTLSLSEAALPALWAVDLLAIESDHPELADEACDEYPRVLATLLVDGAAISLLAVVWSLSTRGLAGAPQGALAIGKAGFRIWTMASG